MASRCLSKEIRYVQESDFVGYDTSIKETARLTAKGMELGESTKIALSDRLQIMVGQIGEHPEIGITYFQPDTKKNGGTYVTAVCEVKIDEYERVVTMTDSSVIPIPFVLGMGESGRCSDLFE